VNHTVTSFIGLLTYGTTASDRRDLELRGVIEMASDGAVRED